MVNYLRVDPEDAINEFEKISGAHARFEFLKRYIHTRSLELMRLEVMTSKWVSIDPML